MKIDVCYFGIIGGTQGKNGAGDLVDFGDCAESYKKNIFQNHDVNVFIHTWSHTQEKAIRRVFNPTDAIFEPQRMFNVGTGVNEQDRFRSISRWYSTKQVINLQAKHNRKPDFIMLSRFDILWETPIDFESMSREHFHVANWNEVPRGPHASYTKTNRSFPEGKSRRYLDLWFIGQQNHMDKLATTYDNIEKIGNHEYDQHCLTYEMVKEFPIKFDFYRGHEWELWRIKKGGVWR